MASKILVVHSSEPAAAGLAGVLKDAGYESKWVSTFDAALREITGCCPDLVVTSVRLGRFNGLHLSLRCHTAHPELPVLVVGIGSDATLAAEAVGYDVRFMVNPPTLELLTNIRDLLTRTVTIDPNLQGPVRPGSGLHGGNSSFTYQ
jgi:DNA-binding NtrC family response regulator